MWAKFKGTIRLGLLKAATPFRRLANSIKRSAQKFIVKSVEKQGLTGATGSDSASLDLVISLLQSDAGRRAPKQVGFSAIPVGSHFLLPHPIADLYYHFPQDLIETAWILQGDFEPDVSAWICGHLEIDDKVIWVGCRQTYHALSAAKRIHQGSGSVFIATDQPSLELLALNLQVNRIENVELVSASCVDRTDSITELLNRIEMGESYKVFVDTKTEDPMVARILHSLKAQPRYVIEGGRVHDAAPQLNHVAEATVHHRAA
jgi:hypothetical protein